MCLNDETPILAKNDEAAHTQYQLWKLRAVPRLQSFLSWKIAPIEYKIIYRLGTLHNNFKNYFAQPENIKDVILIIFILKE